MVELQMIQVKELRDQLKKYGDEEYISVVVMNQKEEKAYKVTNMGVTVDDEVDGPFLVIMVNGEIEEV